jgi:hypothetical protein
MTPSTLSPERRKKVAEACCPLRENEKWVLDNPNLPPREVMNMIKSEDSRLVVCVAYRSYGHVFVLGSNPGVFDPKSNFVQKDALTQTTARLIVSYSDKRKEIIDSCGGDVRPYASKVSQYMTDLIKALATGDVNSIETLCAELLETTDGK